MTDFSWRPGIENDAAIRDELEGVGRLADELQASIDTAENE